MTGTRLVPIEDGKLTDDRLAEWAIAIVVMLIAVTTVAWLAEAIYAIVYDTGVEYFHFPGDLLTINLAYLTIIGGLFGLATVFLLQANHRLGLLGAIIYLPARYFNFVLFTFGWGAVLEITLLGLVFLAAFVLLMLARGRFLEEGSTQSAPLDGVGH